MVNVIYIQVKFTPKNIFNWKPVSTSHTTARQYLLATDCDVSIFWGDKLMADISLWWCLTVLVVEWAWSVTRSVCCDHITNMMYRFQTTTIPAHHPERRIKLLNEEWWPEGASTQYRLTHSNHCIQLTELRSLRRFDCVRVKVQTVTFSLIEILDTILASVIWTPY